MRNKREKKQREIHTPTAQRSKPQSSQTEERRKKNCKREKQKLPTDYEYFGNRRADSPASSRKKSKLTQQPRNAAAMSEKTRGKRARTRARQRENIGRAAAASEWTVAMDYGPRAKGP
jgi:hypothetical protein